MQSALLNDKSINWYLAPYYNQAKMIAWKMLLDKVPEGMIVKKNEVELSIQLENGSEICLKGADNENSLRGVGLHFVVLDEFAFMKPNVWSEIIRPMLTDKGGRALFIGTPRGKNQFYQFYVKGQNKEDGFESWRFRTIDNTAVENISRDVEEARATLPENTFKQEYDAEFLENEGSIFKGIGRCIAGELEEPRYEHSYVLGVDLAKYADFTVLTMIDLSTKQVIAWQRINEVSWALQKQKIVALVRKYNNAMAVIDSTGVGDPIEEDLKNLGINVQGFKFTSQSKQELIEGLQVAIESRLVTFPRIPQLIQELELFEYTLTPSGNYKMGAPSGFHDDCVISLGLAVYGMKDYLYTNYKMNNMVYYPQGLEISHV